jgi:hypothetical protein
VRTSSTGRPAIHRSSPTRFSISVTSVGRRKPTQRFIFTTRFSPISRALSSSSPAKIRPTRSNACPMPA